MFKPLGLFATARCPEEPCHRPYCFFTHGVATPAAGPSRPTRTSPSITLQAKRKGSITTGTSKVESPKKAKTEETGWSARGIAEAIKTDKAPAARTKVPTAITVPKDVPAVSKPKPANPQAISAPPGAPTIPRDAAYLRNSRQAYADRAKALQTLYTQYQKLYTGIGSESLSLASRDAKEEEEEISRISNDVKAYRRAIHHAAVSVSRRAPPDSSSHPSIGTVRKAREATAAAEKAAASQLSIAKCKQYCLPVTDFAAWGYPDPTDAALMNGGHEPDAEGTSQTCDRCKTAFIVSSRNLAERIGECRYHHGRIAPEQVEGRRKWIWGCCRKERGEEGCELGVHVFSEKEEDEKLARRVGFMTVRDQVKESAGSAKAFAEVVAMDCEMIYTTAGSSLARATIVDEKGDVIFDELVRQKVPILDLNSRFSGIKDGGLDGAVMDLPAVRAAACMFIGPETIIVGHGLENDLRALRLLHDKVIDTAVMFPHPKGRPYRRALRDIVKEKLGVFIQTRTADVGHSSAEDAKATLEVLKWQVRDDAA